MAAPEAGGFGPAKLGTRGRGIGARAQRRSRSLWIEDRFGTGAGRGIAAIEGEKSRTARLRAVEVVDGVADSWVDEDGGAFR